MKPIIFENIDERVLVEFLEYIVEENLILGDVNGEVSTNNSSFKEIAKEFVANYKSLLYEQLALNNLK